MRRLRVAETFAGASLCKEIILSSLELRGLKGLRSLDLLINTSEGHDEISKQIDKLPLDFLVPGKYQPRKHIDQKALDELAHSIKTQGVLQPVIVRKLEQKQYEIIAGERRWRAARIAGLTHIPSIISEIEDNIALAYALIENIQREDLNPIEEAIAFERFKNEFNMTHADIANTVGRSRASITNTLRLLFLSEPVKKLLEEGMIDMGHARALLSLESDQQEIIALKIIEKKLSVRETEQLVNGRKQLQVTTDTEENVFIKDKCNDRLNILKIISHKLNNKGSGKIIIHVESLDEIDWLIDNINFSKG